MSKINMLNGCKDFLVTISELRSTFYPNNHIKFEIDRTIIIYLVRSFLLEL